MLNEKVRDLLVSQVNEELSSAYLYLGFENNLKARGLGGFAHWYAIQAREELDHAMLFRDYLINCNDNADLRDIRVGDFAGTDVNSLDVLTILSKGLEHEEYVTSLINTIYNEADTDGDLRTKQFLDWFIAEQAEEEVNAASLLTKYDIVCSKPAADGAAGYDSSGAGHAACSESVKPYDPLGLYLLDIELAQREYEPPSLSI